MGTSWCSRSCQQVRITLETWDFFFETPELTEAEKEGVRYVDEVLQQEVSLVESVQRGMNTPAFDEGRIVDDPNGSPVRARRASLTRAGARCVPILQSVRETATNSFMPDRM